ncbi:MAG: hypothetical protein ABR584_11935, partial [Candidatus Baltobacteraceae bacterium]
MIGRLRQQKPPLAIPASPADKDYMAGMRSKRLNSALVSVGVVALVAGCGGGSMVSKAGGGTTYVPPVSSQMTTATLTLTVPGRRPSARRRSPQYVSPYTSRVDVSAVAAGAPSPWPVATSTSIPTPGPVASGASPTPIPVTMTVPVPIGADQFLVNTYDSGGYLLSGKTSSQTISNNATNNVNLILDAAADCVKINGNAGGSFNMNVFENQSGQQSATFVVTPCDADGYPIPAGQNLSNAIVFATPAPTQVVVNSNARHSMASATQLTFSTNSITTGGDTTVTVTYPQNSNAAYSQQVVPQPLPPALYGGYASVSADPVFLVLATNHDDNTVSVLSSDVQGVNGLTKWGGATAPTITTGLYPSFIVAGSSMNGCAQAGQALVLDGDTTTRVLTLPTPSAGNPTPAPSAAADAATVGAPLAAAIDSSCNVYEGDTTKYVSEMTSQMSSNWSGFGGNYQTSGMGPAPITSLGILGANLYVGLGVSAGIYPNYLVNGAGAGTSQGVGPETQAIVHYDASSLVIAYQPASGGDLYLARFTPGSGLSSQVDLGVNSQYYPIQGMAVDPNGFVWGVTSYYLYRFNPGTAALTTYT